ncbi:MAG: protein kinase [Syntrophomonadaceae bacterium]|nr:protein kinase [Syntrophomonadaceae bacterium]
MLNGMTLGGRYELLDIVGEGGMSKVYRARDNILDRIVAVKILKDEFAKDRGFVERFRSEALSVARISHPNIVNVFDVGAQDGTYYIVMEYVDGHTLKHLIREQGPLTVEKAVDIAVMICDGVHHAHEKGIIHRDIKPHNILITEQGIVKVADFGIAQAVSAGTITYGNNIIGSVHYFSPEQAKGEPVNRTADIYSIGCILFEMVTGSVPFNADSPITIALRHINEEPPSPRATNPEVPPALETIIHKAMAKQPGERFQTAQEMRNALLKVQQAITGALTGDGADYLKTKRKMKPIGKGIIAFAILAFLSGILWSLAGNLFGAEVGVPSIVGKDVAQANEELGDLGLVLKVIGRKNDPSLAVDAIISQDPLPGRKVKAGREIEVILSEGVEQVKVPNVSGVTVSDATTRLSNRGLNLGNIDNVWDEKYAEGIVISQDPLAEASVTAGTAVNLAVSKGQQPPRTAVPDVKGLTLEEATAKLQAAKMELGTATRQASSAYFAEQVASQEPAAGVQIEEGSKINVIVSTGPGPSSKIYRLEFEVPDDKRNYNVVVNVTDLQGNRKVYDERRRAGDDVTVGITYYGTGTAEVVLDGTHFRSYSLQ